MKSERTKIISQGFSWWLKGFSLAAPRIKKNKSHNITELPDTKYPGFFPFTFHPSHFTKIISLTLLLFTFLTLPALADKRIAVLKFEVLAERPELQQFGVGVIDILNISLGSIPEFTMIDRSYLQAVMAEHAFNQSGFVEKEGSIKVGSLLGADILVMGSIQAYENKYRISARFTEAETGKILSTVQVIGPDIFDLQDKLAIEVAKQSNIVLSKADKERIGNITKATTKVAAYDYYIKGRSEYLLYTAEGFKKAIAFFDQALEVDKKYTLALASKAEAEALLAIEYSLSGVSDKELLVNSEKSAKKALLQNKELAEVHRALSLVYYTQGKREEAKQAAETAIRLKPNDAESHLSLWFTALIERRIPQVNDKVFFLDPDSHLIHRAITLNPYLVMAYGYLAAAYLLDNRLEDAVQMCNRAIKISPGYVFAYSMLGLVYTKQNKTEEAINVLKKGLEISPDYFPLMVGLANIYFNQQKYEDAISLFNKTLAVKPDYASAHFYLSMIYFRQEKYNEAIAKIAKTIELDLSFDNFYLNYLLAKSYQRLGKEAEAFSAYKKSLDENPDFAKSHKGLAEWYQKRKQLEEAIYHYEEAIRNQPDDKAVKASLVKIYGEIAVNFHQKKDYPNATENYLSALKYDQANADFFNNLGIIYYEQSKFAEAVQSLKKALELKSRPDFYFNLALVFHKNGQLAEAAANYKKACELGLTPGCEVNKSLGF